MHSCGNEGDIATDSGRASTSYLSLAGELGRLSLLLRLPFAKLNLGQFGLRVDDWFAISNCHDTLRPIPRCRSSPSAQLEPAGCRPCNAAGFLPRLETFASPQSLLIVISAGQPWPTSSIPLAGSAGQV